MRDDEQDPEISWGILPDKYYPDGSPILDDELLPAVMKWAILFEQRDKNRLVGQTRTLYGEKLSTVWLGLDHSFGSGPPLIFETMLFAPSIDPAADRDYLTNFWKGTIPQDEQEAYDQRKAFTAKHYPHDQLQLRYSTRQEAAKMHRRLRWHTLIPPPWRAYLLGELAGIDLWRLDARHEDND